MSVVKGLSKESKKLVSDYVGLGVLKKSQAYHLLMAENFDEIVIAFKSLIKIDNGVAKDIWWFVVNEVWKGASNRVDEDTVFKPRENILFRELLKCKGVITKAYVLTNVLKTPYQVTEAVNSLREMEIIDCHSMSNGDVVYVLNLKFYREVFKE